MDVRGTGGATIQVCPAIDKADGGVGDRDPRDLTEADMTAFVSARSAALKACANRKGSVLPYLNTPNAVRDAVLVMHLMGFRSTDYGGASYGTWYGSAAKKMFPRRFDRVVLDANTDWTQDRLTYVFGTQGESYQRAFDQAVLPWLARHNDELGLGPDPAAVNATIERIRAAAKAGQFGPRITPAIVDGVNYTSARDILMSSSVMAVAYSGLNKAMNGDRSHLDDAIAAAETLAKPPTNALKGPTEANTAYYCNDSGSGGTPAALAARAVAEGRQYPVLNAFQAVNVCTGWVGKAAWTASDAARPVNGVLMTQSEDDAPTAYSGARRARMTAKGRVRMVLVDDAHSHGVLYDDCARGNTSRYLRTGRLPARDVHCQAQPLPGDRNVYEFGNPGSAATPLPEQPRYVVREFVTPQVDATAPSNPEPGKVLLG